MTPAARPYPSALARHPFEGTNVWSLVQLRARTSGDRIAVVWHPFAGEGRTWTYAELARDAAAVAAGMARRGVRAGDRVLIHLNNCPEFMISWYACAALGAVAVTTNTRSSDDELRDFAERAEIVGAITQPRFAERVPGCLPGGGWVVSTETDTGDPVDAAHQPDADSSFAGLLRTDPDTLSAAAPDPRAEMSIQFTSGTTARAKGAVWTHANALWGSRTNAVHLDLHPEDRYLCPLPLFHTNALAYTMLGSLWVGARVVLIPKWSTSRFAEISLTHGCTWMNLLSHSYKMLMADGMPEGHSYRMLGTGACDMSWDAEFGTKSLGWWGMTETITQPICGDPYQANRPGSMGRPAPEYGIAVVRDDGTPVEAEETGNLLVLGHPGISLFARYLGDPEATAAAFDEHGWFKTGDLVTPHADGFLSFTGRAKDMLRVGGENVAEAEVERVVGEQDGVTEVAVVAREDPNLDEVPVAFVIAPEADAGLAERVVAACRDKLADFKVPREVYLVRELPRSGIGKINKVALRAVAAPDADRRSAEASWLADAAADLLVEQEASRV